MSTKNLYTKQDKLEVKPLTTLDEHASYEIDPLEFNEAGKEAVDVINKQIAEMFMDDTPSVPKKPRVLFTVVKGNFTYPINNSVFEPNKATMMSGKNFKTNYKKQLEQYIFNNNDTLDPESLFAIIFLQELVSSSTKPITITSSKHISSLKHIVLGMNEFYTENKATLEAMHQMLNNSPEEALYEGKDSV